MPRPPVKKTRRLSEATELGKLNAQRKFRKKEKLQERLLRYLEKLMDRVKIDPIELMAILGGTVLVHDFIFKMPDFVATIKENAKTQEGTLWEKTLATWFKYFSAGVPVFQVEKGDLDISTSTEVYKWLTAFCISYFAIKHGFEMLSVAKSVFGVGKLA